jgi:predicted CoA-substrate-specific enzyme activase
MKFIGLDAGSVSVKLVVLDENRNKLRAHYERHRGRPLASALRLLEEIVELEGGGGKADPLSTDQLSLSITGSAGRLIASVLNIEPINEIVAQAYSTRVLYPHVKTIIEMGGEDSKLIFLDDKGRSVRDFSMNSVCAAGTGSFLDQQAERLRLTIEEFSDLALRSERPPRIAGRCSVFAKSDMIHLQQIATPLEDIVAGLCFAVARNFKGSISKGRNIVSPVSFQGGVAANKGMVRGFREVLNIKDLFVPEDHALMGAIGAALKDMQTGAARRFDLSALDDFIKSYRIIEEGYPPLKYEAGIMKEETATSVPSSSSPHPSSLPVQAYLGIDIGSISTNLAVIDEKGRLLSKRYLMTAGRPIDAVKQGLSEIGEEIGKEVIVKGVGTTGSGRYMIAQYVGADVVKNEITAQATAAVFIDKDVDTIFEIGGQDSKFISLKNGLIVDFEMNKACAAGTGSFLEEQAEKLNIPIKEEFEQCALSAENPCRLGERCTVFMENSLMANLQKGAGKNNLLAGLAYSIVQNYVNRVVAGKKIGKNIFFQGGVAFNKSVVAAFRKYLDKKITVPPHHDVTGAIGMALIAMRHLKAKAEGGGAEDKDGDRTTFKGFELSKRACEISSFECKGCPNVCEINRVKIAGEEGFLFFGGRCEKYDVKKKKANSLPDLFAFRDEMLWKAHENYKEKSKKIKNQKSKPTIGIPYIFFFHDYLPFWTTLLWELGFDVEISPKTDRQIANLGVERVLSEACFPVKVAYGHIKYLIEKNVDAVFLPSFINLKAADEEFDRSLACPYTQTIPYVSKIAFGDMKMIAPVVNLRSGKKPLTDELRSAFKPFGIKKSSIERALVAAHKAQEIFYSSIKTKGAEVLSSLKDKALVIIGRSYNALDSGMNLELPKKLSALGILSIPFDFLPLEDYPIYKDWPNMYWRSGQRILKAARAVRNSNKLYSIYIGNFLCGPDSFILKYFQKEMGEKPFLHIEIDEHSADAGAITRCEAFIDSIGNQKEEEGSAILPSFIPHPAPAHSSSFIPQSSRTVYITRMSDHAFAIAAAFEHCGVRAEVLPESDSKTSDVGRKYASGKECYPCTVTTGDMIKKASAPGFIPAKSAFFMPSGTGPCRFGQYNVFHRMVLDSLGYDDVPVFSPNQDTTFYRDLGIVGKDFTLHAWKGIVAYELLNKCLHEVRPYEKNKGSSYGLYEHYHEKLFRSLKSNNGNLDKVLVGMRREFEDLPRYGDRKPLIGIIGEIFVRSHRFSNEDLVEKVERLGGEAWLAPVEEWIYYVNLTGLRRALLKKEKSAIISIFLKKFFQKKIEHRFAKYFEGFLRTLREPVTKEILEKASPYLHSSFEGEAILSIGKSIDLLERGAAGVINAMPFGCMPGTIVTAILRGVNRDYGFPCISIPFDGTESPTVEIQLEAFMDQAREYKRNRAGSNG